jgi:polyhydroxyalkanoate synthesis regulator protein
MTSRLFKQLIESENSKSNLIGPISLLIDIHDYYNKFILKLLMSDLKQSLTRFKTQSKWDLRVDFERFYLFPGTIL